MYVCCMSLGHALIVDQFSVCLLVYKQPVFISVTIETNALGMKLMPGLGGNSVNSLMEIIGVMI